MRNDIPVRILLVFFLVSGALNLGCGGGAEVSSSPEERVTPSVSAGNRMQSPTLGFVYAAGGNETRAINGVPGAANLGSPLAVGEGVSSLSFAPGQKYALAEQGEDGTLGLVTFSGGEPGALLPMAGAIPKPEVIGFSPKGGAVVLYSASAGQLQVWAGLPASPTMARQVASGELPGAARLLAIADDGVTLLEGTTNNSVYLVGSTGAELLESVSDLGGMVFAPGSSDALIFDRGAGTLSLLHQVSGAHSKTVLAQGLTGLGGNTWLATDGPRAVITASGASQLWAIDVGSLAVQDIQLPAAATRLELLRLSGHFLLAWQPGQPAWILNASGEKGAAYFVPAAAEPKTAELARSR